jgi:hypothetical protein
MIGSFLGIDKEQMQNRAAEYDAKMGIKRPRGRRRQPTSERRSPRDNPRRSGYAYRYDTNKDEDDSPPILDIDATEDVEVDGFGDPASKGDVPESGLDDEPRKGKKKQISWEERQAAMERVPPADVVAWGPKGQLPINARQKAIEDALKDIQTAKRKLNDREKREIAARDELAILNVDAKVRSVASINPCVLQLYSTGLVTN